MFDPSTFLAPLPEARPLRASSARFAPRDVRWVDTAPRASRHVKGARREGLRYERRVTDVLSAIYGAAFRGSPVIGYWSRGKYHHAIPDGILALPSWTIIVEVKLAHTEAVWEQLMERYLPLIKCLTYAPLRTVEVCRSYDPAVPLGGPHTVIESLHRPPPRPGLEVLRWRI